MRKAGQCMGTGKRKCTWLPRPRPSAFLLLFSELIFWSTYWARVVDRVARRGIWQGGMDIESPAEYKKRIRRNERVEVIVEPEYIEPEVEKLGFLRRIFRRFRGKRDRDDASV
jgi:hypothetical protein